MPFSSGDSSLLAPPSGTVVRLTGGGCPGLMPRSASVGAWVAGSLLWGGAWEVGTGGCAGWGSAFWGGGFSGGFAGCTADGASGMVWSPCDCPFAAGFSAEGGDEDCPQAGTQTLNVSSRMRANSHSVRRNSSPGLSNQDPRRILVMGCRGGQIWCI